MNIRVTGQTQVSNAIAYIRNSSDGLAKYQDQLSSGLRVKLPSDDPVQYPALARAKAESARLTAYAATMSDATTSLNAGVSALQDANDVLTQAKQLAAQGANGDVNQNDQDALATQVDALIDRMVAAGNTQVNGHYLFGGTATDTPPFRVATTNAQGKPATIAYDGSADRGRALIGAGQTVDTKYVGSAVLQQGGGDVFQTLTSLRDALRDPAMSQAAKSQALNQSLSQIDTAQTAIGNAMGEQSSSLATLDSLQSRMQDLKLTADTRSGEIEGTDYAEAVVKMQEQENTLQASLAVSARLLQPSLLSFIGS
jgi:flagellar hook-associated protein 3 FlgL